MGTRSITTIIDNAWGRNTQVCTMYRQYDGYPSGHGKELAEFLAPIVVVNGMGLDETRKIANGAGCLAAQMVQHFKESAGPGGIYLEAPAPQDGRRGLRVPHHRRRELERARGSAQLRRPDLQRHCRRVRRVLQQGGLT